MRKDTLKRFQRLEAVANRPGHPGTRRKRDIDGAVHEIFQYWEREEVAPRELKEVLDPLDAVAPILRALYARKPLEGLPHSTNFYISRWEQGETYDSLLGDVELPEDVASFMRFLHAELADDLERQREKYGADLFARYQAGGMSLEQLRREAGLPGREQLRREAGLSNLESTRRH